MAAAEKAAAEAALGMSDTGVTHPAHPIASGRPLVLAVINGPPQVTLTLTLTLTLALILTPSRTLTRTLTLTLTLPLTLPLTLIQVRADLRRPRPLSRLGRAGTQALSGLLSA